jgi:hypothetical protein
VTSVELTPDAIGCTGTLTKDGAGVAFKLDCVERKVCYGGAVGSTPTTCVPATFSAFSFGYTPSEGPPINICTRN